MGALHDGHTSLIARARAECDVVAVSIFVNPLQFGDPEDIAHYPRTLERDLLVCAESGADVVFVPRWPRCTRRGPTLPSTTVSVRGSAKPGRVPSRPGHFDGVATVVAKLFTIAGPCRAYFGLKDFQQLAVVRRMARELSLPVEVVGCPIVREPDGLALSSRNVRLSAAERAGRHRALARPGRRPGRAGRRRALGRGAWARRCAPSSPPSRWSTSTTPSRSTPTPWRRWRWSPPRPTGVAAPAHRGPGGPGQADRQLRRPRRRRRCPRRTRGDQEAAPTRKDRVSRCAAA